MRYRAYITDIIKGLFEINTGSNTSLPRYIDGVLKKEPEGPEETEEEVIARITRNLKGIGD